MGWARISIATLAAATAAACSPALDWREFVPEGSGLNVTFPCRPDRYARKVTVAGSVVPMQMLVCSAADTTFSVSYLDLADPSRVETTLEALHAIAAGNVQGRELIAVPLQMKGMTASDQALRLSVAGRLPDGAVVQEHAVFFSRGLRVYQATVIGAKPSAQVVETFLGGLRFPA